jgi:hypothetical protein
LVISHATNGNTTASTQNALVAVASLQKQMDFGDKSMTTSTKELNQVIAKEKTNEELAIWLDGLSTGDRVYYTEYPNFHEAAQRL